MVIDQAAARTEDSAGVVLDLCAVIIAMSGEVPQVLTVPRGPDNLAGLPAGPFSPGGHRTLEEGLRGWVEAQTHQPIGYVEQLYTFGDRFRDPRERAGGPRPVSIGYLALVGPSTGTPEPTEARWRDWYDFLPWEDWRAGRPRQLDDLVAALTAWASGGPARSKADPRGRQQRVARAFGLPPAVWDAEQVLERYELMYEAGLVTEAAADRGQEAGVQVVAGQPMALDHRRILATAMERLRGKIKYRPVVFELMPPTFTLLHLQRTVEALTGAAVHKQNFRRLVSSQGLVEPTGKMTATGRGRPAELYRFRHEVLLERPAPGVRVSARLKR